jgi:hypothetical protein
VYWSTAQARSTSAGERITEGITMRKSTIACFAIVFLSVAPAHAQYTTQERAHAAQQAEIRRQNYAQQEATRFLFGPQGSPP